MTRPCRDRDVDAFRNEVIATWRRHAPRVCRSCAADLLIEVVAVMVADGCEDRAEALACADGLGVDLMAATTHYVDEFGGKVN